jgi:hypothetical protein
MESRRQLALPFEKERISFILWNKLGRATQSAEKDR